MRRSAIIMTVSALALVSAGQAMAQEVTPLRLNQVVSGALTDEDAKVDSDEDGQYVYDTYSIEARQGQRLQVVLRSAEFDTYLEAFEGSDASDAVATDDDGLGEETNSRLRFSTDAGTYVIRARTLSGLEGGDYTIEITDRGPAPRTPRPSGIRVGGDVRGAIGGRDPVEEDAGDFSQYSYDAYSFRAREGERFAVRLDSDDFDAMVRIGRMASSGAFEQLAYNDDGSEGLNSYLVFTAPSAGEYIIRAAPLDGETEGDYQLSLAAGPPPLSASPIAVGDTVTGELSASDGANDTGQRADAYRFAATAGDRIVATMSSDDFDTYLELFAENAGGSGGRTSLDTDDDGAGEGTNSRLSHTFTESGEYTLEARAFSGEGDGDYSLTLIAGVPEPDPSELAYGATIQGEIVDGDPRDEENRGFDAYRFSGEQGNRVQVVMRSGDFDTYLQIGSPEGEFSALASDDDGLGEGTDSRLNYILPSTGEFVLRASPLYADAEGLYSLELIDRGPQPAAGSILVGATARGSLGEEDALAEDGSFYDAYRITVKEGDKLRVTMMSNEFDSYLDIGREDDEGVFTSVVSDDDSLSDTHAKIDWSVEAEGVYVIRARSFSQGQTGGYALRVEPKE
ncbi:MAG: PPC domain-containing protein [Pseudomonadota bacterium]